MHLHHNKETKTSLFAKLTVCCSAMLADLVGVVVWAVYQVWLVASLTSAVQASLAALQCIATGTLTPTSVSCGQENHMSSQILPGLYPVSNRSLSFLYLVSGLYLVSIQSILPWKLWPRHSAPADSGERERRRSKTGSPAHHPPARQLPAAHCLPSQHPHTPAKHHWLQGTEQGADSWQQRRLQGSVRQCVNLVIESFMMLHWQACDPALPSLLVEAAAGAEEACWLVS